MVEGGVDTLAGLEGKWEGEGGEWSERVREGKGESECLCGFCFFGGAINVDARCLEGRVQMCYVEEVESVH